jgi:hypothetical protein
MGAIADQPSRIRGANPPVPSRKLVPFHIINRILFGIYAGLTGTMIIGFFAYAWRLSAGTYFRVAILGVIVLIWYAATKNRSTPEPTSFIPLHAFNTEFTSVLFDGSTLSTIILFQIPEDSQKVIERLNRITEAILMRFVVQKVTPPSPREIEDCLETQLVQFQAENKMAVFRLQVITNVHTPAIKRRPDV